MRFDLYIRMKLPINTGNFSVTKDFAGAQLGNELRTKRLQRIAERLEAQPSKSLPQALGTVADREATYRFLNNESISFESILAPHFEATAKRAESYDELLCIHDTTELQFDTPVPRKGLGRLRGKKSPHGFFAHTSLLVALNEPKEPLGLLAVQSWTRTEQVREMRRRADRTEMDFWSDGVGQCETRCQVPLIHVMDRQGDSYEQYAQLQDEQRRFVIRACHDRVLSDGRKLFDTLEEAPLAAVRGVPLSKRVGSGFLKQKKIYPERQSRLAELNIRAMTVEVARSGWLRICFPSALTLNVVHVVEVNPPAGETPICWYLVTKEPINTAENVLKIVDIYRTRWLIEELFKALKTGCQYERLQLESYDALLRALAIYLPVAWQLLRLRYLAGSAPTVPATVALTSVQIEILRAISGAKFPHSPTVRDAMLAIAARGGHIKNNGDPGWLVLARGLHDLMLIEMGWRAAKESKT
jgi:Transposase DNA-binding/Transposase DDE domain